MKNISDEELDILESQINKSGLDYSVKALLEKYIIDTLIKKQHKHLAYQSDYNPEIPFKGDLIYVKCHINRLNSSIYSIYPKNLKAYYKKLKKINLNSYKKEIENITTINQIFCISRAIQFNLEYIPHPDKLSLEEWESKIDSLQKYFIELLVEEYYYRRNTGNRKYFLDYYISNSKKELEDLANTITKQYLKMVKGFNGYKRTTDADYKCYEINDNYHSDYKHKDFFSKNSLDLFTGFIKNDIIYNTLNDG